MYQLIHYSVLYTYYLDWWMSDVTIENINNSKEE